MEYDTGALSLAGLIPFTITTIRLAFNVFLKPNDEVVSPRVTKSTNPYGDWVERLYKSKTQKIKQRKEESISYASKRIALLALGWALVAAQLLFREAGADIQKFDPFEILGISSSATEIEVKKAYKKLSLVHHPDRWATADKAAKALAETRFVMVAKAYEALTDPTARDNFQKYGNPDGRQALEMSIGLPSWLLEKDNQTWVIASYLLLSVIVFPASVVLLTMNAAKSSGSSSGSEPKKIFPDTEELFRVAIRNGFDFRATMELFSLSAEFRQLTYRSTEEKNFVLELRQQLVREEKFPVLPSTLILSLIKVHPFIKGDGNEKAQVLLYIHMYRLHERLNDELKEDLELLLSLSPQICKAMIMHARVTCNHNNLLPIIVFQQHLNQAMVPGNYMLLQLPNILNSDIEDFTVQTLLKLNKDPLNQRDQLMLSCWENLNSKDRKPLFDDPAQERDCEAVLKLLPYRELSYKIGTIKSEHSKKSLGKSKNPRDIEYEFEPETIQGDLVHVIATLKSTNPFRKPTPKATIAYTPFLPHEVKEEWYLILVGGPNPKGFNNIISGQYKIVSFAIVDDDSELELVADLLFLTANHNNDWMGSADWPVGSTKLMLIAMPSCYVDMNRTCQVDLKLTDPSKVKIYKHHEEDERLDLEPTSIYAMMQQQTEYEVDSDFGDGDVAEEEE